MILQMTKDLALFFTGNEPERSPKAKPDTAEQTDSPNRNDKTSLANAKLVTVFPPSKTRNDEDTTKFNIRKVKNSDHTKASAPNKVETKTDLEEAKSARGRPSQPHTSGDPRGSRISPRGGPMELGGRRAPARSPGSSSPPSAPSSGWVC